MIKFYFKFPYLKKLIIKIIPIFIILYSIFFIHASVFAQTPADWYMAGANPQRTSWVSEEVRGNLRVEWYHPIEPYIPYKIQPIAANGKIYVSTAKGLYAFNAANGSLEWVYPTDLPLGQSPTVVTVNGTSVAYVGGYDHKIHAINANPNISLLPTDPTTGYKINSMLSGYTPFEATAGFETNPLVINNTIYAGNRDGKFYALNAITGNMIWSYTTEGPILYSAAYKNNVVYFASNDMYAYAVNTTNGVQVWKSGKFPGQGFFSYWPVIYTEKTSNHDYVIFNGGENYRNSEFWLPGSDNPTGETSLFNAYALSGSRLPQTSPFITGDWTIGTVTLDASILADYFTNYPNRRSDYILDTTNGQEYTYTYNSKQTYAPIVYSGVTRAGSKYPPLVNGLDGVFYQQTAISDFNMWITRGAIVGWKFGTPYISDVSGQTFATDEPTAYSSGGKMIYSSLCCDREAYGNDITIPKGQSNRTWTYYQYNLSRNELSPGYQQMYNDGSAVYNDITGWQLYSGKNQSPNGMYGKHGQTQSPPIPYLGKLYFLKGNSLMAFSTTGTNPHTPLPLAVVVTTQNMTGPVTLDLNQRLEQQVQNMIASGHLQPGYYPAGFTDLYGQGRYTDEREFGEIFDYFSNPADTVYTLILAYPYLSSATQTNVKTYLQNNYGPGKTYDLTKIVHSGWSTGASREWSTIPPEAFQKWGQSNPTTAPRCGFCGYWHAFPPFNFYAAWKYAQIMGGSTATTLLTAMSNNGHAAPEAPPSDTWLIHKPYFINLYAAGYYGYLQLRQLAGLGGDVTIQGYYDHMLVLRTTNFSKDTPYWSSSASSVDYNRVLSVARNFMFLTPEIADYMNLNIKTQVQTAIDEYNYVVPFWFVSGFDDALDESTLNHLYNSPALFQAKAYILKQPREELTKYLDVSAFAIGDLFYIQNLVAAIEAPSNGSSPAPSPSLQPSPTPSYTVTDLKSLLSNWLTSLDTNYFSPDGKINALDASWVIKWIH